jgi:hypothetical protein
MIYSDGSVYEGAWL